ncbi:MAG: T9SS type A sorting domain-containing protein [Bacteroidetes bacterium]|nr:T9SS type A sorting domain-containing protein [Bacteroidota bacterium]
MMKKLIIFSIATLFAGTSLFGQCEPDTVNCKDDDEIPGQICPATLEDATVDLYYDNVITVIPPRDASEYGLSYAIDYILIDSVSKLPEGISFAINADKLYADSAYCVQIYGTPIEAGVYPLSIYVIPFVILFEGQPSTPVPQQTDSTSVVLTVVEASGFDPGQFTEFHVLPNKPNPFSDVTTIGFYTPFDDRIELLVYNILGVLIHREYDGFPPGEYNFDFDGRSLQPGTYFYRVNNRDRYFTGKFIKTKR